MSVFADSSALVKLYIDEPGSDYMRSLTGLITSQLARVEVPSAIWRKQRVGLAPVSAAQTLIAAFEADYYGTVDEPPRFAAVEVMPLILGTAARLTGVHRLRAYDAVQLATAQIVASGDPDCRTFAAYDKALCAAAAGEGFTLIPSV